MSDLFPSDITYVALRPLNKGIIRNIPTTALGKQAVFDGNNVIIGTEGPKRRPGVETYSGTAQVTYPPVRDVIEFWSTDGTQSMLVLDSKFVYLVTNIGFTGIYWKYDSGTVYTSGVHVVGSGTDFAGSDICAGDVIAFYSGATVVESGLLAGVTDTTVLSLTESAASYGSGTDYEIRRAFKTDEDKKVQWTIADNKVVFTDGNRPPTSYDGTDYGDYDTAITYVMDAIEHFEDRLWAGMTEEAGARALWP